MTEDNNINIRPDLTDISNTILHLYEVARYFGKKHREFSSLWYDNDEEIQFYLSKFKDWELYSLVEEFYRIGKDISYSLSIQLPFINYSMKYPVISKYLEMIEAYVNSFKNEIIGLLEKSKKIFPKKEGQLNHWKIKRFVEIHEEMLSVIKSLDNEIDNIKNSDRYKIENNFRVDNKVANKQFALGGIELDNIKLIQDLIDKTNNLSHRDEEGLDSIKRTAEMRIRKIFGDKSVYLNHVEDIYYKFSPGAYWPGMEDKEYDDSWNRGKSKLLNLLKTIEEDLTLDPKLTKDKNNKKSSNKIFVVHGHDEEMKQSVARLIEKVGLKAIILHEQASEGSTIIEKFETYANVDFAVVLLSPDDIVYKKNNKSKSKIEVFRARQNVIFELGFFVGRLGRGKVFILYKEIDNFEMPTDYSGVCYTSYDNKGSWRFDLIKELNICGYNVDANKIV
jgi:predicted nucleotide-binding protein